jgi:hypothetical protein
VSDVEYGDIVWRKAGPADLRHFSVSVGDQRIGQVFGPSRRGDGWAAVSNARDEHLRGMRSVEGFVTRWAATEYLLDVGFRYGPRNPMTVQAVAWRMESEQRIQDLIAAKSVSGLPDPAERKS